MPLSDVAVLASWTYGPKRDFAGSTLDANRTDWLANRLQNADPPLVRPQSGYLSWHLLSSLTVFTCSNSGTLWYHTSTLVNRNFGSKCWPSAVETRLKACCFPAEIIMIALLGIQY
ncbi:hypothetical protein K438DRAFT_1752836 [Mycena galopus ATCC 62051]|nr:hypothetical protein K438DRAFT_1752836 [Mycena galopus ATCC 62051]